jgi:Fe-S cluster assembly protein SufD
MTQAIGTLDRYLADFRAQEGDLAGQPQWLQDLRRRAMAHFQETGLPTARKGNEPWKYTNVGPLAARPFAYAQPAREPSMADLRAAGPWDEGWSRLVFVNGCYSPALSSAMEDVLAGSLAEAFTSDIVERHIARYAQPEYDGFVALNTAFLRDGAFVRVPAGIETSAPLHVLHVTTGDASPVISYPRTLVIAGANSRLNLIESYVGLGGAPYFTDPVTEIVLEDGARVDHHRLLLDTDAYHIGTTRVHQHRDSTFTSLAFSTGPALARNDFHVLLDAPGASCTLRGLYVTTGEQHIDNYLNIDHAKPHCTSRLLYKGILDDSSRAVFGGTVFVRPGADKTDAYQEDKNLLLSDRAEVDSKPALEIYADDVKCGHGATAGAIAGEALFYMQSRGLDEQTAQVFLIKGFASQVLDEAKVESLRTWLEELVMRSLPRFQRKGVTA